MNDKIETRATSSIGDNAKTDRGHKLFNHILCLERLQEEKDEIGQDMNERKKLAKEDGFDTNVMAAILKRRKNGSGQTQAFDELLAEYEDQITKAIEAEKFEPPKGVTNVSVSVHTPEEDQLGQFATDGGDQ